MFVLMLVLAVGFGMSEENSNNNKVVGQLCINCSSFSNEINIYPIVLPQAAINSHYLTKLYITGGTPPYEVFVSQLPEGLKFFEDSFVFKGTPNKIGSFTLDVNVTDSNNLSINKQLIINVNDEI